MSPSPEGSYCRSQGATWPGPCQGRPKRLPKSNQGAPPALQSRGCPGPTALGVHLCSCVRLFPRWLWIHGGLAGGKQSQVSLGSNRGSTFILCMTESSGVFFWAPVSLCRRWACCGVKRAKPWHGFSVPPLPATGLLNVLEISFPQSVHMAYHAVLLRHWQGSWTWDVWPGSSPQE